MSGVLQSARAHSLPHELLSASQAEDRFDAFTLDPDVSVVYEEGAGVLFAEECVRAMVGLAEESGCGFGFSERVTGWKSTGDGVVVTSDRGSYEAETVVFCAGPWTSEILGGVVPLKCERQVPMLFPSQGEACFSPERMPVFIMEETPGRFFYGIPELGQGVKVAITHEGAIVDPDSVERSVTDEDKAPVEAFVSRRLKRLGSSPIASTTCLYSNTPDLAFAVGRHPKEPRAIVVSACSGHGFKFASVLGEVVSDMAVGRRNPLDVSWLGLERFSAGKP